MSKGLKKTEESVTTFHLAPPQKKKNNFHFQGGFFVFLEIFNLKKVIFSFFFSDFLKFFSKFLRLLLNIAEVTTEHQKWPKKALTALKSPFFG